MLAGGSDRDEHARPRAAVLELPSQLRGHARQLSRAELVVLAFDDERERPLEDEVYLLLLAVAVDAAALAWLQRQLVEAERLDPERAPERDEALVAAEVEASP